MLFSRERDGNGLDGARRGAAGLERIVPAQVSHCCPRVAGSCRLTLRASTYHTTNAWSYSRFCQPACLRRWEASYRALDGKKRSLYAPTQEEARRRLTQATSERDRGLPAPRDERQTVAVYL